MTQLHSSRIWQNRRLTARGGFSLLEVLLIITMLSVTILPFTILMTQTGTNARGVYIQSSRSILLNSLMDEATVDRNYFAPLYTNGTMNTSTSESGQVLPWRRVVDTTNAGASDTFKKTIDFYLYNNSTDAANAPRYKTKLVKTRDTMRVRFDDPTQNNGWMDASGQWWEPTNFYDSANVVPGFPSTNTNYWNTTSIVNLPSAHDAELYQSGQWRAGSTINYSANVANGIYTVKLYFVENGYPGRLMDITLENTLMNPGQPFNANLRCGGRNFCGVIQMYDIAVTDGVLNIQLSVNSAATHTDPFINGISIRKRT
jgi:Tfp pilus assembly protein PilV